MRTSGPAARGRGAQAVALVSLAALLAACGSAPVPPSQSPSPRSPAAVVAALEACDPAALVPCVPDDAIVSIPIAGTGLSLTWSSLWASGRQGRPDWDAASLGLGGWSVSAIEAYAPTSGLLLDGIGTWRPATRVPAGGGESAVPTFDASTAYVFDVGGRHVRTVDGRLGMTTLTISYDASGRLASVKGAVAGRPVGLAVQRGADGVPKAIDGIDGPAVQLSLDAQGRLSVLRDAAGHLTSFQWLPGDLLGSEADAMGGVTRYTYDASGRLAAVADADGVVKHYATTVTDTSVDVTETTALGRRTAYRATTDVGGGLTRTYTAPDGTTTTEVEDARGARTIHYPDGTASAISTSPSALWGMDAPVATSVETSRPDGITTKTAVSEALRPVAGTPYAVSGTVTTTMDGRAWVETFDPAARTRTTLDPAGRRSLRTYDEAGRLLSTTAPGLAPLAYTYGPAGRLQSETVGSGAAAMTSRFAYDASSGRITTTRPDGSVTSESVDALGDPVAWTAADGSTTLAAYDAAGRPTELQPPGALDFTLGSSPAGRPSALLPPSVGGDGAIATTTYDADGRPSVAAGPGPRSVTNRYDAGGRLAGWSTAQGQAALAYAPTGQLASATDPSGVALAYAYDGPALAGLRWSGPVSGSVATALDGQGRTTGVTVDGASALAIAYDPAGLLAGVGDLRLARDPATGLVTRETIGAIETDLSYDSAAALVRSTTKVSGSIVLDRSYSRDALGRLSSVVETRAAGSSTTGYTYDPADRLASVTAGGAKAETDAYDAAGDRTSVTTGAGVTKASYDDRQRLRTWGSATYRWRADGTLASVVSPTGTTAFTFDDLGRLTGAALPTGRTVAYLVDAEGRRVGREVGGQLVAGYLYDPAGRVVALTDGGGAVVERFGYDDQGHLALVVRSGSTYAVVTDQVGSPRLALDASTGAVADAIAYDAWGRVTSESAPGFIPFGFAGGLRDADTGLVHFGARDYDPITGRWISSDPIGFGGGDPNTYAYAGSQPTDRTDPSGLCVSASYAAGHDESGPVCPPSPNSAPTPSRPWIPAPSSPTQPPQPPPPTPPILHCWAVWCGHPTPSPNPNVVCDWALCDPTPDGGFKCLGLVCVPPNGAQCSIGLCWYGDTHIQTGDRVHYDFQAAGEFVGARSPDGSVQVQVRQEPRHGDTTITFATAVAAGVAGDRVGVYAKEPSFLVVNGVPAPAPDLVERLPHGGTVERHGGTVTIGWPDGTRLNVVRLADTLDLAFSPIASVATTLQGMFGSADGNATNDLTGRDGTMLARDDAAFATKLYSQFGTSWRVTPSESLFDYRPGESTATFTRLDIPSAEATVSSLPPGAHASAQAVCQAVGVASQPLLDDCILDVGETGDPAFATAEAQVVAAGLVDQALSGGSAGPSPAPPGTTPSASPSPAASIVPGLLTLGQDISGVISGPSGQDDYTFTATAGEIVYGRAEGACVVGLEWVLVDPANAALAMGPLTCHDLGRVVLRNAGTYRVRILTDGTGTGGAYRFIVTAVPPTQVDPISLGRAVTGSIDSPGEWHDYTLALSAGQKIVVTATTPCTSGLSWDLLRPDGSALDFHIACGSMGPDAITLPGTYTLRVHADVAATGPYAFTIGTAP